LQRIVAITMKRCLQNAFCFFICLLLFSSLNAQDSFFKTSSFAVQTHYGSFITILPKAAYLRDSYSYFGEISFQRNNKRVWATDSQMVQWGAGVFFGNTGSKQYVGNMKGAFSFINLPVYKKKNFQSKLRMGGGLGWVQKPYDKNTNHKNVLLGTALNAYLNFTWQNDFKILPKTYVNFGVSFSHLSNGSSTLPNLGLNIPAVSIGMRYAYNDLAVTPHAIKDSFMKFLSYNLYTSLGIKQHPWIGSKRYAVNILSAELSKKISPKHQYGGGVILFYDQSLEVNPRTITSDKRKGNNFQAGLFAAYEYSIGKISLPLQLGAYVFNHDVYSVIFQQFGMRYHFSKRFSTQLMLKSYGGKADVIHAGFGYKWN
jgi:hypothetical protein